MDASRIGRLLPHIWWRAVSLVSAAVALNDSRRSVASKRGLELLKANLTPSQLSDFLTYRCFDVMGGTSGITYRIRLAGAMNVEEVDHRGRCTRRLCFLPEGQLVDGDVMLAQKVALESFESEALAIANKFPPGPAITRW
jgi:hypothetical protein